MRGFGLAAIFGIVFVAVASLLPMTILFVLYWTDTTLILSPRLRYTALGMALLAGLDSLPQLFWLVETLHSDWVGIQEFHGITVASKIAQWLPGSGATAQFGSVLTIVAEQALIPFLIALFLQYEPVPAEMRRSDLLHDVAMLAIIAAGIVLVGRIGWEVYTIANYDYYKHLRPDLVGTPWRWVIRVVTSIPSAALPLVIPFLVLKGQPADAELE
jgi:hypothetical protein